MPVCGYEFCLLLLNSISSWTLKEKIHKWVTATGPHTINAANVGSTRDLISQKKFIETIDCKADTTWKTFHAIRKKLRHNCAIQGVRLIWKQKIRLAICELLCSLTNQDACFITFLHSITSFLHCVKEKLHCSQPIRIE